MSLTPAEDNGVERAYEIGMGAATISSALIGVFVPPIGIALAVATGATQVVRALLQRRQRRVELVDATVAETLGDDGMDAARAEVESDPELAALVVVAYDAANESHHDDQPRAIGRVLASALASPSEQIIDETRVLLRIFESLDRAHFDALAALARQFYPDGNSRNWMRVIAEDLQQSGQLSEADVYAGALANTLNSLGLVSLDPPGFGGYTMTALGYRLLDFARPGEDFRGLNPDFAS